MTTFDKSRGLPAWLRRRHTNKNTQRGQRYYLHLWNAQPPWAELPAIRALYREARRRRRAGEQIEVDHIVPLIHPEVCGLHCMANLRIVPRDVNQRKSNHTYPGMAWQQIDLLDCQIAPPDWDLAPYGEHDKNEARALPL